MPKMQPCCARAQARLTMNEANLRRLAHRAAKRADKGLSTVELEAAIALSKASIADDKAAIVDHEASHAGEVER